MKEDRSAAIVDLTFRHHWQAEVLPARPLILPNRHFVYPREAEEVERGALELLIRPSSPARAKGRADVLKGHDFSRAADDAKTAGALAPEGGVSRPSPEVHSAPEFLATCALGFRDAIAPTGIWSAPNPDEICAVSGGYAYLIDTTVPERFSMIAFRPVLEVRPLAAVGLLLFVGHHAILAWGAGGQAWQSEKLSDEGVTITAIDDAKLCGLGWNMMADKETEFTLELKTGLRIGSA
jgi:hypothetical protein